jgi:hypothetical protein
MNPAIDPVIRMRPWPGPHGAAHRVNQIDGARDVRVDDMSDRTKVLVQEPVPEAMAGIGEERIHGTSPGRGMERVDPGSRRQIRLDGLDRDPEVPQVQSRLVALRLVRGDEEVVPLLGAALRQLVPDARRRAGDDRERSLHHCHGRSSVRAGWPALLRWLSSASAASQSAISSSFTPWRSMYR